MSVDSLITDQVNRLFLTRQYIHIPVTVAIIIAVRIIGFHEFLQYVILHILSCPHIINRGHCSRAPVIIHKKQIAPCFQTVQTLFRRHQLLCTAVRMYLIQTPGQSIGNYLSLIGYRQIIKVTFILR